MVCPRGTDISSETRFFAVAGFVSALLGDATTGDAAVLAGFLLTLPGDAALDFRALANCFRLSSSESFFVNLVMLAAGAAGGFDFDAELGVDCSLLVKRNNS